MGGQNRSVTLAGWPVKHRCHACAFFHDREQEYRLLMPFVKEGFEQDDKMFQIVDGRDRDERLRRIGALGIMDILRTHPQVIFGGILQENPFYVPPERFLQELRTRNVAVQ